MNDHVLKRKIPTLHYMDEDNDAIVLRTDDDLKDAIATCRASGQSKLKLLVPHRSSIFQNATMNTPPVQYLVGTAAALAMGISFAFARKN